MASEGKYRAKDYYECPETLIICETKAEALKAKKERIKDTDGECDVAIEKMINGKWVEC